MVYDVLINYSGSFSQSATWFASSYKTYSEIVSRFKKEINSPFSLVFVRKRFQDKQGSHCTTFKLIKKTSYTFSHFPKLPDYINAYYAKRFTQIITSNKEFKNAYKS